MLAARRFDNVMNAIPRPASLASVKDAGALAATEQEVKALW